MKIKDVLFIAVGCVGFMACSEQDCYDPEYANKLYETTWEKTFGKIDPNQDWNMFNTVATDITVNEDYDAEYTLDVYTANPLVKESGAKLIARKSLKSGNTWKEELQIPKNLTGVYVSRTDAKGAFLARFVQISNGTISTVFGLDNRSRSRAYYNGSEPCVEPVIKDCPYTTAELEDMLAKAKELNSESDWNNSGPGYYKVTSDKNYNEQLHGTWGKTDLFLIVDNGATLTLNNDVGAGICIIIKDGTLQVKDSRKIQNNASLIVLKDGKVKGNKCDITNGSQGNLNYNAGEITLDELNVNGGSFYNAGTVVVKDLNSTSLNGNFINNHYIKVTNKMKFVNSALINNCHCDIKDVEEINKIQIADNGFVNIEGTYLTSWSGKIIMGKSATLYAGEFKDNSCTLTAPSTNNSTNYDEHAFIKFGKVTQWNGKDNGFTGYYVIDPGDYSSLDNTNGTSTMYTNYAVFENQALGSTEWSNHPTVTPNLHATIANYTIEAPTTTDQCSANTSIGSNPNPAEPMIATYAFEDLGAIGDYDFNDVVLQVSYVQGDNKKANVELVAIGGTLPVSVYHGNEVVWDEVHDAYGVKSNVMINTGNGTETKPVPEAKTITLKEGETINTVDLKIAIKGKNQMSQFVTLETNMGEAPQALCIPGAWKWPTEITNIKDAYPRFALWVQNASTNEDWHTQHISGKVYGEDATQSTTNKQ